MNKNVFFTKKPIHKLDYFVIFIGIVAQIVGFVIMNVWAILIGIIVFVYGLLGFIKVSSQT